MEATIPIDAMNDSTQGAGRETLKSRFNGVRSLRFVALLELTLFLAVALGIDYFLGAGDRFQSVSPHPFWLIILLLAGQYGANAALVGAAACSLALLVGALPEQALSQDQFQYWFQTTRLPLLWLVAAVLFGELRMRHISKFLEVKAELEESRENQEALAKAYQRASGQKEKLEGQIAGQMRTVVSTYKAAKAIEQLEPTAVVSGAADMVRTVLNPKQFSIFLMEEGRLHAGLKEGWLDDSPYAAEFGAESPLYQKVAGDRKTLCVVREEDRETLEGEGLLAGPLVDPDSGEVLGMLKIEETGFLDLNLSAVENFRALCDWVGASYLNAQRFQAAKSDSVMNHEHQLFSYGFLPKQIEFLRNLGRRVGFDVFMIIVRLEKADELPADELARIPLRVSEAAGVVLRTTDMSFDYQKPGFEFAFVLPNTPEKGVRIVVTKLKEILDPQLDAYPGEAHFTYTVQTIFEKVPDESPAPAPAPAS